MKNKKSLADVCAYRVAKLIMLNSKIKTATTTTSSDAVTVMRELHWLKLDKQEVNNCTPIALISISFCRCNIQMIMYAAPAIKSKAQTKWSDRDWETDIKSARAKTISYVYAWHTWIYVCIQDIETSWHQPSNSKHFRIDGEKKKLSCIVHN